MTEKDSVLQDVRWVHVLANLIHEPLQALYMWLPFILRKDMGASVFEIAWFSIFRSVALFCAYFVNSFLQISPSYQLVIFGILSKIPFLLFPFCKSSIEYILGATFFFFCSQLSSFGWGEILKKNLSKGERQKYTILSSALTYGEGALIALYLGYFLDHTGELWTVLFALFGVIGMAGILIQSSAINSQLPSEEKQQIQSVMKEIKPLFSQHFFRIQFSLMVGAFAMMLAVFIVPLYFSDVLSFSHFEYAKSRNVFMGLGLIICSPIWIKIIEKFSLDESLVFLFSSFLLFFGALSLATKSTIFIELAFIMYGVAQSGTHAIIGSMGEFFDGSKSGGLGFLNALGAALRGIIAPLIGALIYLYAGPFTLLSLAFILSVLAIGLLKANDVLGQSFVKKFLVEWLDRGR